MHNCFFVCNIILASDPLQETPPTTPMQSTDIAAPPTAPVQSTDTAAIIGGTLGAIAVLVISGIVLLIIFLLQFNKRTLSAQSLKKL